jgi:hypothetical protein
MGTSENPPRPRWYAVPARALFLAFLLTLLSFAVTLLLAISTLVVRAWLHGANPDLRLAYRHVALPVAIVLGSISLATALVVEIQHYRRARTLAGIARASR